MQGSHVDLLLAVPSFTRGTAKRNENELSADGRKGTALTRWVRNRLNDYLDGQPLQIA